MLEMFIMTNSAEHEESSSFVFFFFLYIISFEWVFFFTVHLIRKLQMLTEIPIDKH